MEHPGTTGVIEVDVHIDATAGGEDGSWLTIRTSFSATDEDARVRLLDAWALIGPLASSLADRAARTIKERAERDDVRRRRTRGARCVAHIDECRSELYRRRMAHTDGR